MDHEPEGVEPTRRDLLRGAAACGLAALAPMTLSLPLTMTGCASTRSSPTTFDISLAEWSLHRTIFGGQIDHLDFARVARQQYGVGAIEYVNQFFYEKAGDRGYLDLMNERAAEFGVQQLLIMVDAEGRLGATDSNERDLAVKNHWKWVRAANRLGCHSIRVNVEGDGTPDEHRRQAADSLHRLADFADEYDIDVIVENHGGLSSSGAWLASVMVAADHPRVGTLPDFGNFRVGEGQEYDRYIGVAELMPWARAVSAKSNDFDEDGNELSTDFRRMLRIVLESGYRGWVGIEYEGRGLDEPEGILKTKALLERVRVELG